MSVIFKSQRMDWRTPRGVYQTLDAEFHFDFDPCPPNPKWDGLVMDWGETNFVNPPYGTELPYWVEKAWLEWQKNKTSVLLVPSRTDTKWWHTYCMKADEIRFIQGRLKFDDGDVNAPFPSAIVIFRGPKYGV